MASNDPVHPPEASDTLPYPTTDQTSGAAPYPPGNQPPYTPTTNTLPYPTTDNPGAAPYPPMPQAVGATSYPPMPQSTGHIEVQFQNWNIESKTYTDAPPPYSPPVGENLVSAPGQIPPPQPAAYPPQPVAYPPGIETETHTVQSTPVVVPGNCPQCGVGNLIEIFTLLGLCCAFCFFPCGVIYCIAKREKRCTRCDAAFK